VATEIKPATTFTPAEDYHQNYHNTNAVSYKFYKWNCGRAQRLEKIWGPPPA
jgi:peptide-methionine (S)-S-oxide reductase